MPKLDDVLSSLSVDDALKSKIALAVSGAGLAPKEDAASLWELVRLQVLKPAHPIALHRALADWCFQDWDEKTQGPRPIWRMNETIRSKTNLQALMREKGFKTYDDTYNWSVTQGREFWATMVRRLDIPFKQIPSPQPSPASGRGGYPTAATIVDLADPTSPKWLPGAQINVADACFLADPGTTAIIHAKEGSAEIRRISYGELNGLTNHIASALVAHGCKSGDRIAIDMPMNVEAVAIYLGILKMGGAIVCLADSFKTFDIDSRLEVASPVKLIFTQDRTGGVKSFPLYPEVIKAKLCPPAIVVSSDDTPAKLLRGDDIGWQEFLVKGSEQFASVALSPEAACAILFSSSTSSGKEKPGEKPKAPKAIPWKAHTAIKSAVDANLHHNLGPGKTLCWPTNLGWMMGSFAIFGALINRATLAVFDGSAVSTSFVDFVAAAKVNVLGLVPSIAEAWSSKN